MSQPNVIDFVERRRGQGHEPPEPGQGSVLGVLPVPGTGAALMIVGYLVPAETPSDARADVKSDTRNDVPGGVQAVLSAAGAAALSGVVPGPPAPAGAGAGGQDGGGQDGGGQDGGGQAGTAGKASSARVVPRVEEDLIVDRTARVVRADGREIDLTFREFELLDYLSSAPGRVYNRRQLMAAVWDRYGEEGARTVDVHVLRLRRKLGRHAGRIVTVRNVGYKYQPPRRP